MSIKWAVAVFALAMLPVLARAEDKKDLSGEYTCLGKNKDGGTYKGTVKIAKKGDTYVLKWTIGNNDEQAGIGLVENNLLSVAYYGAGNFTGIVVYKIEKDKLVGKYAVAGDTGVYEETLSK